MMNKLFTLAMLLLSSSSAMAIETGAANTVYQVPAGGGRARFRAMDQAYELRNVGIKATVSGNALTIELKQKDGATDCSSSAPCIVGYRNTSATTGGYAQLAMTASPTDLVISAGSTLGHVSGATENVCVYLVISGGAGKIAASSYCGWDNGTLATTVAEGGNADLRYTLYSDAIYSSAPVRLIGRFRISEATAGTWATGPTEVSLPPFTYVEWFGAAVQNGAASFGTSTDGSPTVVAGAAGEVTVRAGSVDIWAPCATGTDSVGVDCGGTNETNGIVFFPPAGYVGPVQVCMNMIVGIRDNAALGGATFKLAMTGNSDYTISQDGTEVKNRVFHASDPGSVEQLTVGMCDLFHVGGGTKYTIRLFKQVTDTITSTHSGSNLNWSVKPVL